MDMQWTIFYIIDYKKKKKWPKENRIEEVK